MVVRPTARAPREFLFGLFNSASFSRRFAALVTGTSGSHQRVPPPAFLSLEVEIPPSQIVERYAEAVHPILERVALGIQESAALAALRDALLPRLMSGELGLVESIA